MNPCQQNVHVLHLVSVKPLREVTFYCPGEVARVTQFRQIVHSIIVGRIKDIKCRMSSPILGFGISITKLTSFSSIRRKTLLPLCLNLVTNLSALFRISSYLGALLSAIYSQIISLTTEIIHRPYATCGRHET